VVWIEAGILTLYGFVLITIGLLVQAHVIHAFATADHRALAWHAYLWDPWFLIWGLLAIGVLRAAARPPPLRCVRIGGVLGLPADIHALLFDLDGVLTPTAKVHAAAWKQTFDEFLRQRAQETNSEFVPFDEVADYDEYVDGKPREDGVRSFLNSRGVELPEGTADDPTDAATVHGVGNNKNERVLKLIHEQGVQPYEGSARYVRAAKQAGLKRAVVSSSANCRDVLASAGIDDLFDAVVDGVVATREHLHGKPAPDTFLAGAKALGVEPAHAAVFEDALAGVEAGRAGKFGFVVGVDRVGQRDALKEHGADVVVDDLADLLDS
jgi:beta-phosphoglucomutase family hydrolase